MSENKANITARRTTRHWLRNCMTLLLEALIWTGCLHVTSALKTSQDSGLVQQHVNTLLAFAIGIVLLAIVCRFIPNNAYSRTARRDEVLASVMKTALAVGILVFAIEKFTDTLLLASLLFFVALAIERLILNSWFIRYSLRHSEHGIIICNEDTLWQQKALLQNTYGLKLARLGEQSARQLEEYLAAHPEAESVYCAPSAMSAAELEDIAHTCRKQGLTLHILPLAPGSLPHTLQNECRGTICVLSPAMFPLQSLLNRAVKRMTDIVLSLIVLLTVFPVFAVVAYICIKRQSRGPVIIVRHMCGMNGKPFQCLSFRTRHYEAAPSFLDDSNDPGYFPFGKFLTVSRMEFLPQFLCVLWGSMTIVGSQTMRPEHYQNYKQELKQYLASGYCLKAGITAYRPTTQANGSAKADIWYYRNWGFWLDLRIMKRRIGTILSNSKTKSINYI